MFNLAVIGLDSSHSVVFTELIQDENKKLIDDIKVISCLRMPTPFQSEEGLDKRQLRMEELEVKVTCDFDEALKNADGVMLEINDSSLHLEYFRRIADLSIPVFIDKPLADNVENAVKIHKIAEEKNLSVWSASSMRFSPEIIACKSKIPSPSMVNVYGTLHEALAGSSLVWYGVHTFEMLVTLMGCGAASVQAHKMKRGIVSIVDYEDGRIGVVECNRDIRRYGGYSQNRESISTFIAEGSPDPYLIMTLRKFFLEGIVPVPLTETIEVQALIEASEKSIVSGKLEKKSTI